MAINYEARTQAYIDVESSFGVASVNLVDGNLSFNHTDWEFGGGPTAFSLSHIYAGANYNNNQFYTGLNTGNGYGWKTNFDQYLIGDTTGAIYIDASGRKHTFKNSSGTIYDDGGLGLKLTKLNGTGPCKIVTDLVGNTMHFSSTGYLCRIDTIFGNSIFVRHNANGSIKEIENGDNVATFTYNSNNLLSSVSYTGTDETLNFEYDDDNSGNLRTIKKTIGSSVSIQAQFEYTNNRLSRIFGNDYTDTRVTYSSGKVNQISTCSKSQGTALSYTTFTYTSANEAYTTFTYGTANEAYPTNEQGVKFKYTIHNNGDVVKIEEVIGSDLYEVYPDKNPDSKQTKDYYLGTSKLDEIASLNRVGSAYVTFDNTSTSANHLTVDDIRATLQSFAKGNSTFDIFYNNKKDRIAGATAESYSFKDSSNNSVLFSYDMLSQKTIIKDNNNNEQYEIVVKEMFDTNGITTITSHKIIASGANGTSVEINRSYTKYNGLTTYTIESDPDDTFKIQTNYEYDNFGNLKSIIKKDATNNLPGTYSSFSNYSNGEHVTSETNELGKITSFSYLMPHNILLSITSPKNVKKSYSYDAFNEYLTEVTCITNGQVYENEIYHDQNRIESISNATGTFTFNYDETFGDLIQVTTSGIVLYNNNYNYQTRKSTRSYHGNATETTTYDKYGNIVSIDYDQVNETVNPSAIFTYQDKNSAYNSKAKLKIINDNFAKLITTFDSTEVDESTNIKKDVLINVEDNGNNNKGSWTKKSYINGAKAITEYTLGGSDYIDEDNDKILYYTENYDGFGKPINKINITHNSTYTMPVTINYTKDELTRIKKKQIASPAGSSTIDYEYYDDSQRLVGLIKKETISYNGSTVPSITNTYSYDDHGNITTIVTTDSKGTTTKNYTYDNLNRLTKETSYLLNAYEACSYNNQLNYSYDNGGNLSSAYGSKVKTCSEPGNSQTETISNSYTYQTTGWKDLLTSFNGQSILYDNNGFPSTYRNKIFHWKRGMLSSYEYSVGTSYNYTYDVNGRRTKIELGSSETRYLFYDGDRLTGEHIYTYGSTTPSFKVHYLYDNEGIVACKIYDKDRSSSNRYSYYTVTKDILGNVIRLDGTEGCVLEIEYDAFGKPYYKHGNTMNVGNPDWHTAEYFFKLAHKGYYYDNDLELYYLMSRYYDPETGRFISPDSIDYLEPDKLTGVNLYSYCANNPVMYADPSGHAFATIAFITILGAISGAFWGGVSAYREGQNVITGALIGGVVGGVSSLIGGIAFSGITSLTTNIVKTLKALSITAISSFEIAALGNVVSQKLQGKDPNEYNEQEAVSAGISNAISTTIGAYTPKNIPSNYFNQDFALWTSASNILTSLLSSLLSYIF